jgi:hypothetical protein
MKRTCSWLLALAGVLGLAGTTQAGPYGCIPLFFPQLFGQDSTPVAAPTQPPSDSRTTRLDFGFPIYHGSFAWTVPTSVAVRTQVDAKALCDADSLADFFWDCFDALSDLAPEVRVVLHCVRPTTPYHLAAAAVLEYLSAVDTAQRAGDSTSGFTPAAAVVPTACPSDDACKKCNSPQGCPKSSSCPLGYSVQPPCVPAPAVSSGGGGFLVRLGPNMTWEPVPMTWYHPAYGTGPSMPPYVPFPGTVTRIVAADVAEACDNLPACPASSRKACKCCENCEDCKDCTCGKKVVGCGDHCVPGMILSKEKLGKVILWAPGIAQEYLHPPMPCPMPPPLPHPRYQDGGWMTGGVALTYPPPLPPPPFAVNPFAPPMPPPAPYQVMNPMLPCPLNELRELHCQREMIAAAIEQIEQELARIEAQRHIHAAPAASHASSVHLMTEYFEAHCNALRSVGSDPHHLLLEGDVRLTCKKSGHHVHIEAPRVIINMKDGTFTVESQPAQTPCPSAQPIHAVPQNVMMEHVQYMQDASGRCVPVVTSTRLVSPTPVAPWTAPMPAKPASPHWRYPPVGEMLPMPRPVAPPRPVLPVGDDGDK